MTRALKLQPALYVLLFLDEVVKTGTISCAYWPNTHRRTRRPSVSEPEVLMIRRFPGPSNAFSQPLRRDRVTAREAGRLCKLKRIISRSAKKPDN